MAGVRKSKVRKKVSKIIPPKEICTFKEFLGDIDVSYDDEKEWNDGSCTFLIANLEEEQITILEDVGLHKLGYDLFYSETDKINVNEKLRYIKPFFMKEEKTKWDEIIGKIIEIERKCSSEGGTCPFVPSIFQLHIVAKWSGNITTNTTEFKDFVTDLNSFLVESLKDNLDNKYKGHYFWQTITALRHGYSHDTTKWREENKMKIAQNTMKFFQDVIGKGQPNTSVGFVTCQFKLLELCSDFLDSLRG